MSSATHALTIIAVDRDLKKIWLKRNNDEADEGMWGLPMGPVPAGIDPIQAAYDALSQFNFWGQRFKVIDEVTSVEHKGDNPDHPIFHRYTTVLAIIWTHHREKFPVNNAESVVQPFSLTDLTAMKRSGDLLVSLSELEHPEVKKVLGE